MYGTRKKQSNLCGFERHDSVRNRTGLLDEGCQCGALFVMLD
jgi:hypothetical protein